MFKEDEGINEKDEYKFYVWIVLNNYNDKYDALYCAYKPSSDFRWIIKETHRVMLLSKSKAKDVGSDGTNNDCN